MLNSTGGCQTPRAVFRTIQDKLFIREVEGGQITIRRLREAGKLCYLGCIRVHIGLNCNRFKKQSAASPGILKVQRTKGDDLPQYGVGAK